MDTYDIERYEKVHIWIGTNFEPEPDYQKYFELDYDAELDEPGYKVCGFCKDIGIRWYDQDFIGIIPRAEKEISLNELLKEAPVDSNSLENVKAECANLGISKANAIFWYSDGGIGVSRPYKASYNGLKYVGLFEGN
ncbi:hypothetical protein BZK31_05500 [Pseudomonas floridensis]|uniref:Immunity protein 22 n=1 Tax=Pseudomonas floridensis TaxID=1958950 RepID=A0A1X0N9P0_9PSED|nr:immunity 22 family protein [Pseudomonas floridensis]ORC60729.1 hypothetical protein BZK31_05500 [Pseudomonas floridensis]